jgi:hypothetical protein
MALPHPHGAASGQIAHNSNYDTGVTPGSTGGKFIGFGEEGTSSKANRAHWALSQNIDYVYQILADARALPAGASYTVPGGGVSSYQVVDDVFLGDSTYPGSAGTSDPEGMLMLFAVLDDQYNELTDGSDNEVRVKRVRDATDVTDMYKQGTVGGFETNPILHFHTVDPATGVEVTDPYTIPAATDIRILYGAKGDMENLPIDAFTRFKTQSASEVEAGAFLQDGTKKMTGDFDADENDVTRMLNLLGASGQDLTLRSLQKLYVQADEDVLFNDQYLSSPLNLNFGYSSLYTPASVNDSIIGQLRSTSHLNEHLWGSRSLERNGAITFTGATGQVAYPELRLCLKGEYKTVAAGNVTATDATDQILVVDAAGAIQQRTGSVTWSDVIIAAYRWNSGGSTWVYSYDARYNTWGHGEAFDINVGDGINADTDNLFEVAQIVNSLNRAVTKPRPFNIRILNNVTLEGTASFEGPVNMIGMGSTEVTISCEADETIDFLDFNGEEVHLENLGIAYNYGTDQASAKALVKDPGHRSTFKNVRLYDGGAGGYMYNAVDCGIYDYVTFEDCRFEDYKNSALPDGNHNRRRLINCYLNSSVNGNWTVDWRGGTYDVIENCSIIGLGSGIRVGANCRVENNYVFFPASSHGIDFNPSAVADCTCAIRNNYLESNSSTATVGIEIDYVPGSSGDGVFDVSGNHIGTNSTALADGVLIAVAGSATDETRFVVQNNYISGVNCVRTSGSVAHQTDVLSNTLNITTGVGVLHGSTGVNFARLLVQGNTLSGGSGTGVSLGSSRNAKIIDNSFYGGAKGVNGNPLWALVRGNNFRDQPVAVEFGNGTTATIISDNFFWANQRAIGVSSNSSHLNTKINNNYFLGCSGYDYGSFNFIVSVDSASGSHTTGAHITNNYFDECGSETSDGSETNTFIYVNNDGCVHNNRFKQFKGNSTSGTNLDLVIAINVVGQGSIQGNWLEHDFSAPGDTQPQKLQGIRFGAGSVVKGNTFDWYGTHSESPQQMSATYGLYPTGGADHFIVEGNFMDSFSLGSPNPYFLYAPTANSPNQSVVSNNRWRAGIFLMEGSNNIFMGNQGEEDMNCGTLTSHTHNILIGNKVTGSADINCQGDECTLIGNMSDSGDVSGSGITNGADGNRSVFMGNAANTGTVRCKGAQSKFIGNTDFDGAGSISYNNASVSSTWPYSDQITNIGTHLLIDQLNN